jgi:MFS family permease
MSGSGTAIDGGPRVRTPVSRRFVAAYAAAYTGTWILLLTPVMITMSLRVRELDPGGAAGHLALVLGVGALVAMAANPVFGRLSDRTTSRFGRRRPWMIIGLVCGLGGLATAALAPTIALVLLGWCIAQLGFNALLAAQTAVLADQVPPQQRGRVSAVLGVCSPIGQIAGTFLVDAVAGSMIAMFAVPAAVGAAAVVLFAVALPDRAPAPERPRPGRTRGRRARTGRAFALVWLTRFLLMLAFAIVVTYQSFFLIEELGAAESDVPRLVFTATLVQSAVVVATSAGIGRFTATFARRRAVLLAGTAGYGVGLWALAASPDWPGYLLATAAAAVGLGAHTAVALAVATDVLPPGDPDAARNLGLYNIATALPQSVAPVLGSLVLAAGGGYPALFVLAGVAAVAAAPMVGRLPEPGSGRAAGSPGAGKRERPPTSLSAGRGPLTPGVAGEGFEAS